MKHYLYITLLSILLSKHYGMTHVIRVRQGGTRLDFETESLLFFQKRQLFREQVLPHAGGKIPDSAFHTDRLALNRLQKDGIAVPDGVLLEQRRYQVHPHLHRTVRPTILVAQTPDGRYTSPEGWHSHNGVETVDTTYLVPMPWDSYHKHSPALVGYAHRLSHSKPVVPVLKELRVPNYSVFNFDYSNFKNKLAKKPVSLHPTGTFSSAYSPAAISHHAPKPSLSLVPQNYVGYHAGKGPLVAYRLALFKPHSYFIHCAF